MRWPVLPLFMVAACGGGDDHYIVVTVSTQPTVHDASSLDVTLAYGNDRRYTQSLDLQNKPFPVTFTLTTSGDAGALGITVDAKDSAGSLVGRGVADAQLDAATATVTLDSADFVVNSEYANDQFLNDDYEAVGYQLAAASNGTWMVTWRDACDATSNCQIFGRRFDATGLPVTSTIAAGDIAFRLSTLPTTDSAQPAAAASGTSMAAFWDFEDSTDFSTGIACRALDDQGASSTDQVTVTTGEPDVVSATGIPNGNYAIVWTDKTATPYTVYGAVVTPSCAPAGGSPFVVSADAASVGTFGATRANVAANGSSLLYSWVAETTVGAPDLWIATGTTAGNVGPDMKIILSTATQSIEHVRIAPWGDGFAIAVRWLSMTADGPGKIEVYRATTGGVLQGGPVVVTDQSGSDYPSDKGFSIAERASDHALIVVWHVCPSGAGLCDVYGRMLRPTGAPVGEPFMIPTATDSDQLDPSVASLGDAFVAAWTDSSGAEPDRSGTAVRARVFTPVYDDARGVHGATCGASAPGAPDCGEGLACAMGTDAVQRCYYLCASDNTCPAGGSCQPADGGVSACTF